MKIARRPRAFTSQELLDHHSTTPFTSTFPSQDAARYSSEVIQYDIPRWIGCRVQRGKRQAESESPQWRHASSRTARVVVCSFPPRKLSRTVRAAIDFNFLQHHHHRSRLSPCLSISPSLRLTSQPALTLRGTYLVSICVFV